MSANTDSNEQSGAVSRRHSLRLAVAAIVLGRTLGLPPELLADENAPRLELKYFRSAGGTSELVYAEPLAAPVIEALMTGNIAEIELKWYHSRNGLLGTAHLPAELQLKLERIRG